MAKTRNGKRTSQENIPPPKGVKKETVGVNGKSAKGASKLQEKPAPKQNKKNVSKIPVSKPKQDVITSQPTKRKPQPKLEQVENTVKKTLPHTEKPHNIVEEKTVRSLSEADEDILAENERRFQDQRKRSIYVSLPGKLDRVSVSALKALHPDILNVNKLAHSAFLIFSSEAVRDKAFPIIEKAHLKNHQLRIDYCCEKSKSKTQTTKIKQPVQHNGINLTQLVVSDLPKDTVNNVLEIVFPKSNDIKILKGKGIAYVNFQNEVDALEAFKKGKVLKISSVPVVVRYRFVKSEKKSNEKKESNEKAEDSDEEVAPKKRKLIDEKGDTKKAKKGKHVDESDEKVDPKSNAKIKKEKQVAEVDAKSNAKIKKEKQVAEVDAKSNAKAKKGKQVAEVDAKSNAKAKKGKPVIESSDDDESDFDGEALDSDEDGFDGAFQEIGVGESDLEGEDFAIESDESSDGEGKDLASQSDESSDDEE